MDIENIEEQHHEADVWILQRRQVSHKHWRLERFQWCRTCRWCHCFNSPRHFYSYNEAKGKRAQDVAARCHTQQHCQGWAARRGHVLPPGHQQSVHSKVLDIMSVECLQIRYRFLVSICFCLWLYQFTTFRITPDSSQCHPIPALHWPRGVPHNSLLWGTNGSWTRANKVSKYQKPTGAQAKCDKW